MRKLFLALALTVATTAYAQDNLNSFAGPMCDTADQMKRAVVLFNGGLSAQDAIEKVNQEERKPVCGILAAAVVTGAEVATVEHKDGSILSVIEITVFAIATPLSMQTLDSPVKQFTIIRKPGQGI